MPGRNGSRTVRQGFEAVSPSRKRLLDVREENAVAKLLVVYKEPKDKAAFDAYYFSTHVPIAKKIPGLKKYSVSTGGIGSPAGPTGNHLIATLQFDGLEDIQKAFASLEGQAAAADIASFADGGADMLIFDEKDL